MPSRVTLKQFWLIAAILLASCVSAIGQKPGDSIKILLWSTDVRPALESVICVTLDEQQGIKRFEAVIANHAECPGSQLSDPLLVEVANLLAQRGKLMRARAGDPSKAFSGISADDQHLLEAQDSYRAAVLENSEIRRRLMPRLHRLLSAHGAACPDCPGPTNFPPARKVSRAELMPYILAYYWPVRVQPDGRVTMMICAGTNGIQAMKSPDPVLSEAGFDVAFGNWDAIGRAMSKARGAAGSEECKKPKAGEEQIACVRKRLAEVLPRDPEFFKALQPGTGNLTEIGLTCSDCH